MQGNRDCLSQIHSDEKFVNDKTSTWGALMAFHQCNAGVPHGAPQVLQVE